jgi:hypothetical protein
MSTDYVKRYFNKVNGRITTVNKQDPFSSNFTKAIASGQNVFFQKHLMETRIFDGSWVDYIEENLRYLDNVIRNPKSFIKDSEEIVPIERAKKTTAESIRHLASHSQYIKSVSPSGEVMPKKILTIFKEEDLAIYENRFVKTLTDKLVSFVERRYETIKKLIGTDYINKFHTTSEFKFDDTTIEYELNLNISKTIKDIEAEKKNFELLDRVENLRSMIIRFLSSEFMSSLKSSKPVFSPIQRTNILMKDFNYRKCYDIWLFLDSYGKLDYSIESSTADQKFNDEYINKLNDLALLSFSTIVANEESSLNDFSSIPTIVSKAKKPKILNSFDVNEKPTSLQMESQLVNEYYYQEARKIYSRRINDRVNDGESFHVALQDIYQGAFKITEAIFENLMEIPENTKDDPVALLRFKIRNQQALDQIYKYKLQDLKKMEKLKLQNEKQIKKAKAKVSGKPRVIPMSPKQKEKERERLAKLKLIEKEKAKLAKQKEREKAKLARQKEREKEKARLARVNAKEKARLAKEREKEKARLEKEKLAKTKIPSIMKTRVNKVEEVTNSNIQLMSPNKTIINEDLLNQNVVIAGSDDIENS